MIGLRRTGNLALVAIQAQSQSPTILRSPLMVSQLQLLGRVGIHGFSAWASDNLLILSLTFQHTSVLFVCCIFYPLEFLLL